MSLVPPKIDCNNLISEQGSIGYMKLLGNEAWSKLHPDIQKRFSEMAHQSAIYQGIMSQVDASFAGKIFAKICRLVGTPLANYSGVNIPITVKIYPNKKLNGMTWDRFYAFPNKPVNRVRSTKVIKNKGGLVEIVGCGFGMKLDVSESNGALLFSSTEFFWEFNNRKFILPDWLSPGKTVVVQKALSDGRFEFRLTVEHPLFGFMFRQVGVFKSL